MRFIITALFWIGVVFAFTPSDFYMSESALAQHDVPVDAISGHLRDVDMPDIPKVQDSAACENNRDLCTVIDEFSSFAGFVGEHTLNRVEGALNERFSDGEAQSGQ